MFSPFPKQLIDETILCFKEENGIDLSVEEASHYLDSFAELFLVFADVSQEVDVSPNVQVKKHQLCGQVD